MKKNCKVCLKEHKHISQNGECKKCWLKRGNKFIYTDTDSIKITRQIKDIKRYKRTISGLETATLEDGLKKRIKNLKKEDNCNWWEIETLKLEIRCIKEELDIRKTIKKRKKNR